MFTVLDKYSQVPYTVYDIKYDSTGYPHFLIYLNGEWVMRSAKHYRPAI